MSGDRYSYEDYSFQMDRGKRVFVSAVVDGGFAALVTGAIVLSNDLLGKDYTNFMDSRFGIPFTNIHSDMALALPFSIGALLHMGNALISNTARGFRAREEAVKYAEVSMLGGAALGAFGLAIAPAARAGLVAARNWRQSR